LSTGESPHKVTFQMEALIQERGKPMTEKKGNAQPERGVREKGGGITRICPTRKMWCPKTPRNGWEQVKKSSYKGI